MNMSIVRRMREKAAQAKEALLEHAYLITLGAVVAVVAASAMYTSRVQERHSVQIEAAANAPEIEETPSATAVPQVTPLPTIAPLEVHSMALMTGGGRVWPVSGAVIRAYSPEEPVYWEALSCYQAHQGTDVAGQAEEEVLCVMDGVVERVTRDELWGWRVSVAQTDGAAATYAGLASCDLLAGQAVTRGQALGTLLAEIPCEAELGAHLHLELMRDGEAQDPQQLLEGAQRGKR